MKHVLALALLITMIGCAALNAAEPATTAKETPATKKPATMKPAPKPATTSQPVFKHTLYKQIGTDITFAEIMEKKMIPVGKNSTEGITGSKIDVDNEKVEDVVTGKNPIPKQIAIHTLGNSFIPREDFGKWTRWYQEDGNTQIFRLFKGEHNVRNSRPAAARVEAFGNKLKWKRGDGWHEWQGVYTIIKPHGCSLFQAKNNINHWSVMINLSDKGDIKLNHRRHKEDVIIARNMTGKSFHLRVRDNGHEYEVFLDGKKVGDGHYDRRKGMTTFRWGMYDGTIKHDALIFVTGARFYKVEQPEAKDVEAGNDTVEDANK